MSRRLYRSAADPGPAENRVFANQSMLTRCRQIAIRSGDARMLSATTMGYCTEGGGGENKKPPTLYGTSSAHHLNTSPFLKLKHFFFFWFRLLRFF